MAWTEDMPECCGATVLCGLSGLTKTELRDRIEQAKKPFGVMLATTALQPTAEKLLKAEGFKMTGSGKSNHGSYKIKVWTLDLKAHGKPKPRAKKKSSLR